MSENHFKNRNTLPYMGPTSKFFGDKSHSDGKEWTGLDAEYGLIKHRFIYE